MNDDKKKPVGSDSGAGKQGDHAEDTSIEVKFGGSKPKKSDGELAADDHKPDHDTTDRAEASDSFSPVSSDSDKPGSEELSNVDHELERIEGIESIDTGKAATELHDTPADDDAHQSADTTDARDREPIAASNESSASVTAPVDLATSDGKDQVLAAAVRKQTQEKKTANNRTGLVAVLLGLLVIVAGAAAGYFYWQSTEAADRVATLESDVSSAQAKNRSLEAALQKDQAAADAAATAAANASAYREIPELGVKFKDSDATKNLIFGYTATPAGAADAVAVSTKALAKLAVGNGASPAYPCAFSGNVPTIARYTTDARLGSGTVSQQGKKIGEVYYVYTAPAGNCAPTEIEAQNARNTGAKAVYDALEALSSQQSQTATTQPPQQQQPAN